jgi:hypothetical protein
VARDSPAKDPAIVIEQPLARRQRLFLFPPRGKLEESMEAISSSVALLLNQRPSATDFDPSMIGNREFIPTHQGGMS